MHSPRTRRLVAATTALSALVLLPASATAATRTAVSGPDGVRITLDGRTATVTVEPGHPITGLALSGSAAGSRVSLSCMTGAASIMRTLDGLAEPGEGGNPIVGFSEAARDLGIDAQITVRTMHFAPGATTAAVTLGLDLSESADVCVLLRESAAAGADEVGFAVGFTLAGRDLVEGLFPFHEGDTEQAVASDLLGRVHLDRLIGHRGTRAARWLAPAALARRQRSLEPGLPFGRAATIAGVHVPGKVYVLGDRTTARKIALAVRLVEGGPVYGVERVIGAAGVPSGMWETTHTVISPDDLPGRAER